MMSTKPGSPAIEAYARGAEAYKREDFAGAIGHFRAAVEADAGFHRGWAFLAMAHAAAGDVDRAIEAYRKCIEIDSTYHKAYNNVGELYRRKGQLDYAAMVFKMATEIDGRPPLYHYNLGLTYADLGLLKQAEESLARAQELDPSDFESANELAQIRFNLRKFAEAVGALRRFVEAAPEHERSPEARARIKLLERKAQDSRETAVIDPAVRARLKGIDPKA